MPSNDVALPPELTAITNSPTAPPLELEELELDELELDELEELAELEELDELDELLELEELEELDPGSSVPPHALTNATVEHNNIARFKTLTASTLAVDKFFRFL